MQSYRALLSAIAGSGLILASAAQAQDASQWSGVYGGLSYSSGSGSMTYYAPAPSDFDIKGQTVGAMLGYNFATGPWVLGAELAYNRGSIHLTGPGGSDYTFTSIIDLKARAGIATDNLLFYGTVGTSLTEWQEGPGHGGFNGHGGVYGVGVDFLVSPKFFVGAEYLRHDVDSDWNLQPGDYLNADFNTLTLRAAYKF